MSFDRKTYQRDYQARRRADLKRQTLARLLGAEGQELLQACQGRTAAEVTRALGYLACCAGKTSETITTALGYHDVCEGHTLREVEEALQRRPEKLEVRCECGRPATVHICEVCLA